MKRSSRRGAFTLIELLLVVLMTGMVMSVVFACFFGGLRVFERVSSFREDEIYRVGEQFAHDLKNAIVLPGAVMEGSSDSIAFSASLYVVEGTDLEPQRVRYQGVAGKGILRSVASAAGAAADRVDAAGNADVLLAGAYVMRLRYLPRDRESGVLGDWQEGWSDGTNLPMAVRLMISDGALAEEPIVRTVMLAISEGGE